jgi:TonB-dependent receptor
LINFVSQPVIIAQSMARRWENNTDQDYTGYVNFIFTPSFMGSQGELSVGGMYRDKKRTNFFNEYQFEPAPSRQVEGIDWDTFADARQRVLNPAGGTGTELTYNAYEKMLHSYVQAKFMLFGNTQIVTGIRTETTDQGYQLLFPRQGQEPARSQHYTDLLPSLMVKYPLNERMNLRGSYFRSISRPGYFEIVPYRVKNEDFDEVGNPDLKRVQANNYDLRWEFFPTSVDQLLVGAFYKNINDPIEEALVTSGTGAQNSGQIVLKPGNFGTANNWGLEIDYTKYVNKFGVRANYTFTESAIASSKVITQREDPANPASALVTKTVSQTRPLQGQAQHIGNLSVLFKDQKKGIDAQLSFVYTGSFIQNISPFVDNDWWTKPILQMDVSAEKKLGKHIDIFARVQNLLNSPFEVVIRKPYFGYGAGDVQYKGQTSSNETLIRRDLYYMSFRLGFRYTL